MDNVAIASINTFGPMPKADVLPSEDPIFVMTSGQLQEIISRAIQPLQDRIESLESMVAGQGEEIAALKATVAEQHGNIKHELDGVYSSLFLHRNQIDKLSEPQKDEPGETETARAEKIRKYLLSQPGRRASYESLRGHLDIDKFALNDAINVLMETSPSRYGVVRSPVDKRKRILVMTPR